MRLTLIGLAFLSALLPGGCVCDCDVDAIVRARAGPGATDCGFVPLGEDLGPTLDCIDLAMAEGRAVRAGWQSRGRDSEVRTYLAGHDGSFSMFGYDGGVSGYGCPRFVDVPCDATPVRLIDASGRDVYQCPGSQTFTVCDR